jgi:DUF2892 family protein
VHNVGGVDRMLRAALGLILLSFIFLLDGAARWLGLIGALPLATALLGWCPAYALLGLGTDPRDRGG